MRTFASGARLRVVLRIAAIAVLTAALGAQTPVPSERERADSAAKRTADRLRALQRESDALAAQERTLLADLRKLEVDRQIAIENLARIERDLAATSKKLDDAEARAAELARTAAAQLPDVEARLVQLYKLGRAGYWRLLLNVDDLQALARAYRTASTLTAIDRAREALGFEPATELREGLQAEFEWVLEHSRARSGAIASTG